MRRSRPARLPRRSSGRRPATGDARGPRARERARGTRAPHPPLPRPHQPPGSWASRRCGALILSAPSFAVARICSCRSGSPCPLKRTGLALHAPAPPLDPTASSSSPGDGAAVWVRAPRRHSRPAAGPRPHFLPHSQAPLTFTVFASNAARPSSPHRPPAAERARACLWAVRVRITCG
jgi:hypothetical protein